MKAYFINNETQTIRDALNDKIIYFGYEDFMNDIVKGNKCFVCGTSPEEKEFNDEHIIPDWILRKFDLYNEQITLPNGAGIKYGQYKVPCCKQCNSNLGKLIESPISTFLSGTYNDLIQKIKKDPSIISQLYIWMCLLYIKTHLKDTTLLQERDRRIDAGRIGDHFDWKEIHHVHCMSRVYYTGAKVHKEVYGSILILPVIPISDQIEFDYMDSVGVQAVMVRLGEICIIAVLNDSGACQTAFSEYLEKISAPLTIFQLKEIFAHMVYINFHLKERPLYQSTINDGAYEIQALFPENLELIPEDKQIISLGELLHFYVHELISDDMPDREKFLQSISDGKRGYLFNEKGEFIKHAKN